jgi:hypothetical protein
VQYKWVPRLNVRFAHESATRFGERIDAAEMLRKDAEAAMRHHLYHYTMQRTMQDATSGAYGCALAAVGEAHPSHN